MSRPHAIKSARTDGPLAVITCHFNFGKFDRPRQNLCRFSRQMETAGIPVYGVELHLEDEIPFTQEWDNWIQIACGIESVMFQKERLLNIIEKAVPDHHRMLAWIDADVMFMSPRWIDDTVEILSRYEVAQLFRFAHLTKRNGMIERAWRGAAAVVNADPNHGHTGFAWAARRELWKNGGLYDGNISGSGDVFMAAAFLGCDLRKDYASTCDASNIQGHYWKWRQGIVAWITGWASYVDGTVVHEWHGDWSSRGYAERREAVIGFNPERHLKVLDSGIYAFNDSAPKSLTRFMRSYFLRRKED